MCPWHFYKISLKGGSKYYQALEMDANRRLVPSGWKAKEHAQRVHVVERRGDELFVKLAKEGKFDSDEYGTSRLCGERSHKGDRQQASAGRDGTMADALQQRRVQQLPLRSGHVLNPPSKNPITAVRRPDVYKGIGRQLSAGRAWDQVTVEEVERRSNSVLRLKLKTTRAALFKVTKHRSHLEGVAPAKAFSTYHLKLSAVIGDESIERPYTPVASPSQEEEDSEYAVVELGVRVYPQGAMSQYLNKLTAGQRLNTSAVFTPAPSAFQNAAWDEIENIILIGGGSGVTPLIQVAQQCIGAKGFSGKVDLICCNHSPDRIVALEALNRLQEEAKSNLQVTHLLKDTDKQFNPNGASILPPGTNLAQALTTAWAHYHAEKCAALWCGPGGFCAEVKRLVEGKFVRYVHEFEG